MATEIIVNDDGWTDFTHDGQRWSFDADQLAQWVEEEEEGFFEFHSYHGLVGPTVESVVLFIDNLKIQR